MAELRLRMAYINSLQKAEALEYKSIVSYSVIAIETAIRTDLNLFLVIVGFNLYDDNAPFVKLISKQFDRDNLGFSNDWYWNVRLHHGRCLCCGFTSCSLLLGSEQKHGRVLLFFVAP